LCLGTGGRSYPAAASDPPHDWSAWRLCRRGCRLPLGNIGRLLRLSAGKTGHVDYDVGKGLPVAVLADEEFSRSVGPAIVFGCWSRRDN
ncbi:unnamed protein product, partial [Ectocarpus fasciculatus]